MHTKIVLALGLAGAMMAALGAQEPVPQGPNAAETPDQRDARMKWWREAKFGLFIHWGVYAVPAGTYQGKPIPGIGEWIMNSARIPVAEYRAFAKQFNPVRYDPEAWAQLAKQAGMKYVVITSKHHDGFALFDSKVTDWDAVDATPYGKDLIRPLADAVRRAGLKFGLYYSQAQDWTHPGGAKAGFKEGESWDSATKGSFDDYLKAIAVPQAREILTQYQPDILWWDTPVWMTRERADLLSPLLRLRPGLITNNRLGGGYAGDTDTPEQFIPSTGIPGRDWEVCMTMNDTWGFKSDDDHWKSTEDLVRKLVDIASKGGNFLLNVGPTAAGEIPAASIERLQAVGKWMAVNGEAIHATSPSPFRRLPWGRCTRRAHAGGTTLYLHVFAWPKDGRLLVPGLKNEVGPAKLLAGGATVTAARTEAGVVLSVPAAAPDPIATVIAVEVKGAPEVEAVALEQQPDGVVRLGAEEAEINNPGDGDHAQVETHEGVANVGYWTDARAWIQWTFRIKRAGTFAVILDLAGPAPSTLEWGLGRAKQKSVVEPTGDYRKFKTLTLGTVTVDGPGPHVLILRPVANAWKPINVRSVTLRPVP